jgi:hypothetical protein
MSRGLSPIMLTDYMTDDLEDSIQSAVVTSAEEEEIGLEEAQTRMLFAEWDPEADRQHKARLVKYGEAIFSRSCSRSHSLPLTCTIFC